MSIFGNLIGFRKNGSNGLKSDVATIKTELERLRTAFEAQTALRSGYIVQLESVLKDADVLFANQKATELMVRENRLKIDENANLIRLLTERVAVVAQRGHDLADEIAPYSLVLQMVCEKVKIPFPERR